jgi:hypothetical protein
MLSTRSWDQVFTQMDITYDTADVFSDVEYHP